eukprot:CAMPEP_0175103076 /NCGR_PEP_ID=MMETSP0086_2-20121207/8850_1 /TAXON_ID=136419 /ORGANISM="Unknown Unknown, Strain D1" /LENGTH=83 /DNA_ID=CAMNT_0016378075 /DNA_START=71 /DNA_END=322 /DNA_ORIENTATION=+
MGYVWNAVDAVALFFQTLMNPSAIEDRNGGSAPRVAGFGGASGGGGRIPVRQTDDSGRPLGGGGNNRPRTGIHGLGPAPPRSS